MPVPCCSCTHSGNTTSATSDIFRRGSLQCAACTRQPSASYLLAARCANPHQLPRERQRNLREPQSHAAAAAAVRSLRSHLPCDSTRGCGAASAAAGPPAANRRCATVGRSNGTTLLTRADGAPREWGACADGLVTSQASLSATSSSRGAAADVRMSDATALVATTPPMNLQKAQRCVEPYCESEKYGGLRIRIVGLLDQAAPKQPSQKSEEARALRCAEESSTSPNSSTTLHSIAECKPKGESGTEARQRPEARGCKGRGRCERGARGDRTCTKRGRMRRSCRCRRTPAPRTAPPRVYRLRGGPN